jgi:hypothetical protein
MGNSMKEKIVFVIVSFVIFFLGVGSYQLLDSVGGGSKGMVALMFFFIVLFGVMMCITVLVFIMRRRMFWKFIPLFVAGVLIGCVFDRVFITPAEYGERGWAWAVAKYGAWRVLR